MKERGYDRLVVHSQLKEDASHGDRMHDVGLTGVTALVLVLLFRVLISLQDLLGLLFGVFFLYEFQKVFKMIIILGLRGTSGIFVLGTEL